MPIANVLSLRGRKSRPRTKVRSSYSSCFKSALALSVLALSLTTSKTAHSTNNATRVDDSQLSGAQVFNQHCILCHGEHGKGDGRLAKLITNPSPADLTASQKPISYLRQIINKGGDAMARSPKMPAWNEQLSKQDIDAVIRYIITLRQ
jgi:cytochrome c oxidase cbb3-type subunit 3